MLKSQQQFQFCLYVAAFSVVVAVFFFFFNKLYSEKTRVVGSDCISSWSLFIALLCYVLIWDILQWYNRSNCDVSWLYPVFFNIYGPGLKKKKKKRIDQPNFSNKVICITNSRKAFWKIYWHLYDLVSKFNVDVKSILKRGLYELECYCDLVYKFRKIVGRNYFLINLGK